jgi:hypothetical protein
MDPETKIRYLAQVAFKVLVRPGAKGGCNCTKCKKQWPSAGGAGCKIGQQTLRGTRGRIDPIFDNSELEWYTEEEERGSIICTGLLVRLVPAAGGKVEGKFELGGGMGGGIDTEAGLPAFRDESGKAVDPEERTQPPPPPPDV